MVFFWREGILPSLAPQGAFPSQTQPARLTARGKAECLPSKGLPNLREPVLVSCASATRHPRRTANSHGTNRATRRCTVEMVFLLEGRHSAFPGAARRLSFANAASAPDGAREGRMPSLLKALPMSGSQSLFPARRRSGVLGGLQTRMEQIAQRVDAPWKWSSVEGRHSAFPGAARRLDAPWKWSSSGGKAFCLPWRRKAPFLRKRSQRT